MVQVGVVGAVGAVGAVCPLTLCIPSNPLGRCIRLFGEVRGSSCLDAETRTDLWKAMMTDLSRPFDGNFLRSGCGPGLAMGPI